MTDTEKETMPEVAAFFAQDRFAAHTGVVLMAARPGYARARMEVEARHLNANGTAHGGAIFTLADFCFGVAANTRGTVAVGINTTIAYVKAVKGGTLFAEAREVSQHTRLATYTVDITDDTGEVVAVFQGTAYRKKNALPPA